MDVFADERTLLGVPNCCNVLSNVPFLVVGAIGLRLVLLRRAAFAATWMRCATTVLFLGVALVAFGSAWYHLLPTSERLAWDRAPMTLVFTSLTVLVAGDRVSEHAGRVLFVPLVAAGIATVVLWRFSGVVWPYAIVQYGPLAALPFVLFLRPAQRIATRPLAAAFGCYVVAKLFEVTDRPVYEALGFVSGHTLKHLAAAASTAFLLCVVPNDERTR